MPRPAHASCKPSPARPSSSSRAAGRGRLWPTWTLAAIVLAVLAAGGVLVWQRIVLVQEGAIVAQVPQGVTRNPATRARGAVVSISGEASHPVATYDPASGTVYVRFQSRYYDPHHTAQLNRQYLATEGRLVVQLVLYQDPEVGRVVVELYQGGKRLATVSGAPGDAYTAYPVEYAKGLP